jgi:MFS family permease
MREAPLSTTPFRLALFWLGQMMSLVGSGTTAFALGIWVYQKTGSVTQFGWVLLSSALPAALAALFSGAVVDRHDRRKVMMSCDVLAGLGTVMMLLSLRLTGSLSQWHVYAFNTLLAVLSAFHWPAYSASITQLVPVERQGHINGAVQMSKGIAQLSAPLLGGVLLSLAGMSGILALNILTYLLALLGLALIRIPEVTRQEGGAGGSARVSLVKDVREGWRYLAKHPELAWLQVLSASSNLLLGVVEVLFVPLGLALTTAATLGGLMTLGGVGMLLGSIALSLWGGPRNRIAGVLVFDLIIGLCVPFLGLMEFTWLAPLVFIFFFSLPMTNGCAQTYFQQNVEPAMQGRVFALGMVAINCTLPLAYVLSGPLVEHVFNPMMHGAGSLTRAALAVVGSRPEQGTRLLLVLVGVLSVVKTLLVSIRLFTLLSQEERTRHENHGRNSTHPSA